MKTSSMIPLASLLIPALMSTILLTPDVRGQATATAGQGITGSVTDTNGAAIPDAAVSVVDNATGIVYPSRTTSDGYFNFPGLPVGTYRVTASKAGFQTTIREGVVIEAGFAPNIPMRLKVGATTQQVIVQGDVGTLDTTASFTGEAIPKEALENLPVIANGGTRSPLDYLKVFEGVSPNVYNAAGRGGDAGLQWSNIEGVGDGGGYSGLTSYKVDGVDQAPEQTQPFGGNFAFPKMPAPEAIQEARLTTNPDADQGFNLGATYELITRSGTSHYHGEAYEYLRNNDLDATSFLTQSKPPEKQNDFGATFGGRIPFTKHQFFFVNYQGFRSAYSASTAILTVPTALMRQGNFTEILGPQIGVDGDGNPVYKGEIYDPLTTHIGKNGALTRNPFPGNIIPSNRLSSVSSFFQNGYPMPNLPGTQNNFGSSALADNSLQDKLYIKTDHQFGQRHRLSLGFEWFIRNGTGSTCGNVLEGAANYIGFSDTINNCSLANVHAKNFRLNYTFLIRPDLVLAFNTGVAYDPFNQILAQAGLTAGTQAGLTGTFTHGTPVVNVSQSTGFGQEQNAFIGNEYIVPFDLSVTWTRGEHQFKFGSQFNHVVYSPNAQSFSNGGFTFDGGGTNQPSFTAATPSAAPGYGWADFLLGWVDSGQLQSPFSLTTTSGQWAWYALDQWRVTPKLTLNLGLRWELYLPPHESSPIQWSNFCPTCPNAGAGGLPGAVEFLGNGPGRNGRTTFMNIYPWAIAPRLGIAYAVTPNNVIRLYYGIMRYPLNTLEINGGYYPYDGFGVNLNQSTTNGGVTPIIPDWDQGTFHPPATPDLDPTIDNGNGIPYYNYHDNVSHPQQALGASYEHQFPRGWVASVKYAGKLMHGLPTNNLATLNQLPVKYLSLGTLLNQDINSEAARAANIPIPYAGFTGSVLQALRPYPQFQNINENTALIKNMYWNAVMFDVRERLTNGLTLLANLTLSNERTNDPITYGGQDGNSYGPSRQAISIVPPLMQVESFGDIGGDRPVVSSFAFSYELPFGKGKQLASQVNSVVDAIIGGWQVSGILTYGSGTPEQISATGGGVNTLNIWAVRNQSVPLTGTTSCTLYNPRFIGAQSYINPDAYSNPATYTLGDTLQETERRGCGIANEDLSLAKNFALPGEGRKLQIGANAGNAFNRHTWWFLNGAVGTPGFGTFGGISPSRAVQVYAHLFF
jgi:hypothetical protein